MTDTADFLFELGTEELPPKALITLRDALAEEVRAGLEQADLAHGGIIAYAAPRRLAVRVADLATGTEPKPVERRGPAVKAAFDNEGNPTKALAGFAASVGVEPDQLTTLKTDKGEWLVHRHTEPGKPATDLLPGIVERALDRLPTPKRMRWGASRAEFIRPVHWVLAIHGDDVVDMTLFGHAAGNCSFGHRFHHPDALTIKHPADYVATLRESGHVLADFAERRERIEAQVTEAASRVGGTARIDPDLLDEVTALVEWPVAVAGQFEERFLEVPHEALIYTMQDDQKYFPVLDDKGALMPWFVTVANIDSRDMDAVRHGNERVIRPRFSDAMFFWEGDLKTPLESHLESLKQLVFQKRLGSVFDKVLRIERLADFIAERIHADPQAARRAARLSKCDLQTQMVGEFAGLQGTIGYYLARHEGMPEDVAVALDDHYRPRRAGDELPRNAVAQAVALADRLDTLMGIFAIGQAPTGAKDPFALRRAALGVLRILVEQELDLDLVELLTEAAEGLADKVPEATDHVMGVFEFITERQHRYSLDRGIRSDVFQAVSMTGTRRPLDFEQRMRAVNAFIELPEAEALAAANKRIANILKKTEETLPESIDEARLVESAEQRLWESVSAVGPRIEGLLAEGDYTEALTALAALREPVDEFFDTVMVMAEDDALRRNRLALLARINALFLAIADVSQLQS
ncbi:MAG: glycine--tRNA ligase subunit beta [Guyparkeria sp.]|uniref:glycine--tRNA ligase subunit beta n=1 Tax=Guyparkeria sp. TaxID=2035736 RepID=UPI00397A5C0E